MNFYANTSFRRGPYHWSTSIDVRLLSNVWHKREMEPTSKELSKEQGIMHLCLISIAVETIFWPTLMLFSQETKVKSAKIRQYLTYLSCDLDRQRWRWCGYQLLNTSITRARAGVTASVTRRRVARCAAVTRLDNLSSGVSSGF